LYAYLCFFFFYCYSLHRYLHSFPTTTLFRSCKKPFYKFQLGFIFRIGFRILNDFETTLLFYTHSQLLTSHTKTHHILLVLSQNRSEEHTSEVQSRRDLVCRLLLEKKTKRARRGRLASAVATLSAEPKELQAHRARGTSAIRGPTSVRPDRAQARLRR